VDSPPTLRRLHSCSGTWSWRGPMAAMPRNCARWGRWMC
jgi:hypothetical protein